MINIPANAITRISLLYKVGGINCMTSFHVRQAAVVTFDNWRTDISNVGGIMMDELRRPQSTGVLYYGAIARVLNHSEIPSLGFNANRTGQTNAIPLPAVNYFQIDLHSISESAAGRRRKNAMRLSGIATSLISNQSWMEGMTEQFLDHLKGRAGSTFYSGFTTYDWVIAYQVADIYTATFISAITARGSARVLSSRQR
jgi:hypothetical protein